MKKSSKKIPATDCSSNPERHIIKNKREMYEMVEKFKEELKTGTRYKLYFNKYNSISVEAFIDNYAIKKSQYVTYGKILNSLNENANLRRQLEAEEHLREIQRKKLFDLECQWRAEVIIIPEIQISMDFEYWNKNIENCPFLSNISEDEFELYTNYIFSDDFYDFKMEYKNLNYSEIKETYKEYGSLPPWFEYYDLRKGTGSLLILPDIRGEKEEYYFNIWQSNSSKSKNAGKKKKYVTDSRPYLKCYDFSTIEEFIKEYEDRDILEYFRIYENELNKSFDDIDQAVKILKEADEIIPIENNYDWKSAVLQAARKYEQSKLSESLKVVYDKYNYRLKVGITPESLSRATDIERIKGWCEDIKGKIIQARALNNEPADLNF
jgi:hypothetical protein